jgi:putative nucleotidyltransferase with HDIG domain
MNSFIPDRSDALRVFKQYNDDESLLKHALAVEAVMRNFARKNGEDEETWGIIGLVHDIDYQQYPKEHCSKAAEILQKEQWPESYIRAVVSHGWGLCSDVKPETLLEKTLYAVDELTGLVAATALVRPSKSVLDMQVKSVKKKWKDRSFAAGVNRDVITKGAEVLSIEIDELIAATIEGMRDVAEEIGLQGTV